MNGLHMMLDGARFRRLTEWEFIAELRDDRGYVSSEYSQGQVELAKFILADPFGAGAGLVAHLSESHAVRVLTGEIIPAADMVDGIEIWTKAIVREAMWSQPTCPPDRTYREAITDAIVMEATLHPSFSVTGEAPRHVQIADHLDLVNTATGVTLVTPAGAVTISRIDLEALRGCLNQLAA